MRDWHRWQPCETPRRPFCRSARCRSSRIGNAERENWTDPAPRVDRGAYPLRQGRAGRLIHAACFRARCRDEVSTAQRRGCSSFSYGAIATSLEHGDQHGDTRKLFRLSVRERYRNNMHCMCIVLCIRAYSRLHPQLCPRAVLFNAKQTVGVRPF